MNFMVRFINEQRDAGKRRRTWKLRHAESLLFLVLVRPYLCVFPSPNGFDYLLIKLHTMACTSCRCFIAIRTKNTTNTSHQTISVTAIFIFTEVTLTNSSYCGRGLNLNLRRSWNPSIFGFSGVPIPYQSGFRIPNHCGFRIPTAKICWIPDSLTWGDKSIGTRTHGVALLNLYTLEKHLTHHQCDKGFKCKSVSLTRHQFLHTL